VKANPQIKMMRTGKSSAAGGQRSATGPLASFCVGQNSARSRHSSASACRHEHMHFPYIFRV